MDHDFIEQLENQGLLEPAVAEKLHQQKAAGIISLRPEIMTVLYLGVMLLSSGLGILIYKNIDTIGHSTLLGLIAALSIGCYYYCWKHKAAFSWEKVSSKNHFFDYLLLLASLLMISFFGYLQYQYKLFGDRWDLATLFPMLLLFFTAYYFDHLGILSLAITHLAAWAGLTITPLKILQSGNFSSDRLIYTAMALGLLLNLLASFSSFKKRKAHFEFTYLNFGLHVLMVALMAKMFGAGIPLYAIWYIVIAGGCFYYYYMALQKKSFYLLLCTALYAYVATIYATINLLENMVKSSGAVSLLFFLLVGISIGLIFFLVEMNKKIKSK